MKIRYGALIGLAFCTVPASSFACSNFDLEVTQTGVQNYNPNAISPTLVQIELNLLNGPAENTCTSKRIDIISETAGGIRNFKNGAYVLPGMTPSNSSTLATYSEGGIRLTENAVAQLVSTGSLVFEYTLIPAAEYVPAGRYMNLLSLQVDSNPVTSFQTEITVEPAMRLLGDVADGQGTLDFGVVQDNAEVSSVFLYQSNTDLNVRATSDNRGALVHERGGSYGQIPYNVYINNSPIASNGSQLQNLNPNVGERSLGTINVKIPSVGKPSAGSYSDVLTLSFSAS